MEYKEPASIEIRPYDKAWKIDNTIYSIGNFTLPRGIAIRQIGFFILALLIIAFLSTLIPPLAAIPGVLLYVAFPILISIFLLRYKMDGMSPPKFLFLSIRYLLTKRQYIENFKVYPNNYHSTAKFRWYLSRGPIRKVKQVNHNPAPVMMYPEIETPMGQQTPETAMPIPIITPIPIIGQMSEIGEVSPSNLQQNLPQAPDPTGWILIDSPTINQNDCPFLDQINRENLDCGSCIFHYCKHHKMKEILVQKGDGIWQSM